MNGAFKTAFTKAKNSLFPPSDTKATLRIAYTATDIVPLVNKAWKKSFGDVSMGKSALVKRGWNPMHRCLMIHPEVKATMLIEDELAAEQQEHDVNWLCCRPP
jgi:hypothetical protein